MDYRNLKWGELKSFAKSQGIKTTGKKKVEILEELDNMTPGVKVKLKVKPNFLKEFKGIKEEHPFFKEAEPYVKYLKAYNKIKAVSNVEGVSKGIATIFMKYIETDKNAVINLNCGRCIPKYYERLYAGYNRMAKEHGEPTI